MKRYEYIIKGGKDELAVAIVFCLATYYAALIDKEMSCEELKRYISLATKDITLWLEEEVEE